MPLRHVSPLAASRPATPVLFGPGYKALAVFALPLCIQPLAQSTHAVLPLSPARPPLLLEEIEAESRAAGQRGWTQVQNKRILWLVTKVDRDGFILFAELPRYLQAGGIWGGGRQQGTATSTLRPCLEWCANLFLGEATLASQNTTQLWK